MNLEVFPNKEELGAAAARLAAQTLRNLATGKERLTVVLPTGASQIAMMDRLVNEADVPWNRVDVFHLDEYVGLSPDHPASFRRYLLDRFVARVPELGSFNGVRGDAADLDAELKRLNGLLAKRTVDVCLAGIGENGHLAFNDPPADFESADPYLCVALDEVCRQQQVNEGWFGGLAEVPSHAITMSIRQIMKSDCLIITVPDVRKATAVRDCLENEIDPRFPASILRQHPRCFLYLDPDSSSLLQSA